MRYAQDTSVSVEKSRAEIETILDRYARLPSRTGARQLTATTPNPSGAAISTAQMVQDRRLARLFAHVGELVWAWDEGVDEDHAVQALADDLMLLAPEFLPPSEDDELETAWRELIDGATS